MIEDIMKDGLRHRIKQTPFKALEKAVEEKALERGSKLFHVSSYRNSRVCPIHFTRLERPMTGTLFTAQRGITCIGTMHRS